MPVSAVLWEVWGLAVLWCAWALFCRWVVGDSATSRQQLPGRRCGKMRGSDTPFVRTVIYSETPDAWFSDASFVRDQPSGPDQSSSAERNGLEGVKTGSSS